VAWRKRTVKCEQWVIHNRAESIGRLVRKLGKPEQLRVCYEAGRRV